MNAHVPLSPAASHARDQVRFRMRIFSDLRLDLNQLVLPPTPPDCDAVLVAGGVARGLVRAISALADVLASPRPKPVIFVPGPVEYSDGVPVSEALAEAEPIALERGISLLHDTSLRLSGAEDYGLHVLGATLWPDFTAGGAAKSKDARGHARQRCKALARTALAPGVAFQPHDAVAAHWRSRTFLQDALATVAVGGDGFGQGYRKLLPGVRAGDRALVLTAFPPSPACLPPALARSLLDPIQVAWHACDMTEDLEAWGAPACWVHGRTPTSVDLRIGRTRVVANPHSPDPTNGFDDRRTVIV